MYKWTLSRAKCIGTKRFLSGFTEPKAAGFLVEDAGDRIATSPVSGDDLEEPRSTKFDPRTVLARKPVEKMIDFPEHLTEKISAMTLPWEPQLIRQQASKYYQQLAKGAPHSPALESIEVEAQITGLFLQTYGSLKATLLEAQKRMPENWAPSSVLEVGFGPLPGLLVTRSIWPEAKIEREVGVVLGHPRMKRRAKELLAAEAGRPLEEETVVLRDKVPSIQSPGRYDLIIASHQIYQGEKHSVAIGDSHAKQLSTLLNPGGILVLVERGSPLGFEAIARAREVILRSQDMDVVAPCSHRAKCPLQMGVLERRTNREKSAINWCRFTQNLSRPRWTTELKKGQYLAQKWDPELSSNEFGGKGRGGVALSGSGRPGGNAHEIASYSYLVVRYKAEEPASRLPRILAQPMKQPRRVVMAVCAPDGDIERWTVTKSQGKQAYHDARKARQGDLWALDAKVKLTTEGVKRHPRQKNVKSVAEKTTTPSSESDEHPTASLKGDWWAAESAAGRADKYEKIEDVEIDLEESMKLVAREEQNAMTPRQKKLERQKRQRIYRNFNEGD